MNTTTLRGVFPEPKPVHRRNFVRENIRQLKAMHDFIQEEKVTSKSQELKPNKFKHVTPKVFSNMNARKMFKESMTKRPISFNQNPESSNYGRHKTTHIGVQTERPEDISKLYESGTLKYPSPSVTKQSPPKTREQGDNTTQSLTKSMQILDLEEKQNFIRQNIKSIKNNKQKQEEAPDPLLAPPSYQRGALPKYLKDKKPQYDNKSEGAQYDHVSGLVLLPDDERKEYLRVARENYASLIKELNSMPVSNDTLKKRRRKMEIEDELKRLDEVIKIFQKPKVFVKADA